MGQDMIIGSVTIIRLDNWKLVLDEGPGLFKLLISQAAYFLIQLLLDSSRDLKPRPSHW